MVVYFAFKFQILSFEITTSMHVVIKRDHFMISMHVVLVKIGVLPDVQATTHEVEKQKFCSSLIAAKTRLLLKVMNNKVNSHEL